MVTHVCHLNTVKKVACQLVHSQFVNSQIVNSQLVYWSTRLLLLRFSILVYYYYDSVNSSTITTIQSTGLHILDMFPGLEDEVKNTT